MILPSYVGGWKRISGDKKRSNDYKDFVIAEVKGEAQTKINKVCKGAHNINLPNAGMFHADRVTKRMKITPAWLQQLRRPGGAAILDCLAVLVSGFLKLKDKLCYKELSNVGPKSCCKHYYHL